MKKKFRDEYFCRASLFQFAQAYVQPCRLKPRRLRRKNYRARRVIAESLRQRLKVVRHDCECESNMPRR